MKAFTFRCFSFHLPSPEKIYLGYLRVSPPEFIIAIPYLSDAEGEHPANDGQHAREDEG